MAFTEDDLEVLKKIAMQSPVIRALEKRRKPDFNECPWVLALVRGNEAVAMLDNLLERLAAAEKIATWVEANHPSEESCTCQTGEDLQAWRKAAGK